MKALDGKNLLEMDPGSQGVQGFFPSNAFMAFARSFNMFYCMLQNRIN